MTSDNLKHPDPKLHRNISFFKSGFRLIAAASLMWSDIYAAGGFLFLAELLGIVEEMV